MKRREGTIPLLRPRPSCKMKLPVKLGKEPLIEALFELRFTANAPAASILPGMLFSNLGSGLRIEKLPASELPQQLRNVDPNMMFAPLVRVLWDKLTILISDRSIAVASTLPYIGWKAFQPAILRVLDITRQSGLVTTVERFSLKYTDIIPSTLGNAKSLVRCDLRVGDHDVTGSNFLVRTELTEGKLIHIVNIGSPAVAALVDGTSREGVAIDVDSIQTTGGVPFAEVFDGLASILDSLHDENKRMFFSCLTPEAIEKLEPSYG